MIKYFLAAVFFLLSTLSGCSLGDASNHAQAFQQWMTPNGKVKVLSTIAMIDDLVKQVGGDHVDTLVLIKGELDPHSYQLVKGDDEKLAFADLIFYNGLGLEHGPSLQNYLLGHGKALPLGNKIMDANPDLILYYKGQLDPHIWMDISIWQKAIPFIVDVLSQKDPYHEEDYRANGAQLMQSLSEAHRDVKNLLQEIPPSKRYLVTSHDAFNYFARAYLAADGDDEKMWQERFIAPEGLAPESQISTTDIQETINHLQRYKITVIFPESNINRDSIRKIVLAAREKGLNVKIADVALYADAMGSKGSDGDTYIKMIHHNAKIIAEYLKHNGS
jgi:manganese/zinc/iron transport system substrate-binding protein